MATGPNDLQQHQTELIERLASSDGRLDELPLVFSDPGEAFVCCPVQLSMRQLARIYTDSAPEDERHRFPSDLRRRSRDERWMEQRAVFQAKRVAVRKDAILNAEAEVWAIFGFEFHNKRIRGLWERWEALQAYVMDGLERCEAGEAQYSTALRDAARELRDTEEQLAEIMPTLGIPNRAQRFWGGKSGDREEIIGRIEQRLASVAGGSKASHVFEVIQGGGDNDGA